MLQSDGVKEAEVLFGYVSFEVIGFLALCLIVTLGFIWRGILTKVDSLESKIDNLDDKIDKYLIAHYEDRDRFVTKEYIESDLKPWIRDLEEQIRLLRDERSVPQK